MNPHETAYLKAFWNEIVEEGERLRNEEMPALSDDEFFLYHKTGNRLIYENVYFTRRKYLTVFGILAEYGKRQEDIDKLDSVIDSVCRERFWALPAHVDFDNLDEKTIDLFAAETAQTLAEILILMQDKLSLETVAFAKREIMDRVLTPFCNAKPPYIGWETNCSNWSAVCAGSVGMAAIYMYRMGVLSAEWKELCLKRVYNALQCYLGGMEDDGACTEGLGYFSYGMSYYTAYAQLLYEETEKNMDLMRQPKCEKIAAFQEKCYFGKGISLSFSDGSCNERFLPGLTAYLTHCFPAVKTPDYAAARFFHDDNCYRWLPNERNIRWLLEYGGRQEQAADLKACDLLPSAQWMICKDSQGNGFAAKGGHNDENHNHNDIGHFLCVYNGEMLLTDLGAGEYTKDYFHEGRYQILCNRSLGHSVPIINDCEQCPGREYHADSFEWNEKKQELEISFAGAYPKGHIDRISRKIHMEDTADLEDIDGLQIYVRDCFAVSKQTKKITENLITPFKPRIICVEYEEKEQAVENEKSMQVIEIEGQKSLCRIEVKVCGNDEDKSKEQSVSNLRIVPKEHFLHDGSKTTVYLIQWDVDFEGVQSVECVMRITVTSFT
ncbi:MAG: heparinase II/III family protein [Butyrivibrio sp.]|nr:heparinase II/III family protein [Butyrivibrio sp.]